MKKIIAVIIAAVMLLGLAGCGKNEVKAEAETMENTEETISVPGGWEKTEDPSVPDHVKDLFDRITEKLLGMEYVPVAYIGSQIVNGTNYRILCRIAPVVPDGKETWAIVTIHEELDGEGSLLEVEDFEAETGISDMPGGWRETEDKAVTEETKAAFDKAMEGLLGVDYSPVAVIATQTVNGTNRAYLAEATVVYPGAETEYVIVTVHAGLDGSAELLDVFSLPEAE